MLISVILIKTISLNPQKFTFLNILKMRKILYKITNVCEKEEGMFMVSWMCGYGVKIIVAQQK